MVALSTSAPRDLDALRREIRAHTLADESALAERLCEMADIGTDRRRRAQEAAASFVESARANADRSSLIDKFLQEYGLSTAEGVTLMRLAEALLRTPDAATADALIKDKVEVGDWSAHVGKSRFPLVNFSTRGLMIAAAWLDEVEPRGAGGKLAKSTKDILDRVGDPVIRAAVGQAMRIMGEHFVLGETIAEAFQRGRAFAKEGYAFSFDMLGEAALTAEDAAKFYREYDGAIAAIARVASGPDVATNPGISVKLSALHPRYEYAKRQRVQQELVARVKALAVKAREANIGFNIDAEEAERLDLSLDIIEALARDADLADWDGLGVVVQAYQRRATFTLEWLAALARDAERKLMVRLVKGAYWDAEIKRAQVLGLESYPVFTRKALTDVSYLACARVLIDNADVIYPQFATHNAVSAAMVEEMAGDAPHELQRLHGMGEALHDRLVADGRRSRIYAPVGGHKELLPYLVRRLLENGANSSFVNQLIDPDLSVEAIITDPIDAVRVLDDPSHHKIPDPRDLFSGMRLSAEGWDFCEPDIAETLETAVSATRTIAEEDGEPVINPADGAIVGYVRLAGADDVDAACKAAKKAAGPWGARPPAERADILRRAADALEASAPGFMRLAAQEAGKTIPDGIAEVREAVDFLRFYADGAEALDDAGGPLGVVACISPWNFPLAIFLGQVSAALAAGNAVLAKPAEQTPLIAKAAVDVLYDAGVPSDVLHFLPGDGPTVGGPLVTHPAVDAVVFTGSTATAKIIARSLVEAGKPDAPLIAETGGINAMVIDSTALMEQAVKDVVASAFQSAGQRCSACRVVCVQADVADRFYGMLAGAMAELSVGDPTRLSADVGPVIDAEAKDTIGAAIARLRLEGRLVAEAPPGGAESGLFVRPIAFEVDSLSSVHEEIFGPVLQCVRFKAADLIALVEEVNGLGYGLTLGIHTRIDETMRAIVSRARVGNIYVNRNQIGAVVGVQPFGGEALSGTGPKAGGPHYLDALRRPLEGAIAEGAFSVDDETPALLEQLLARAFDAYAEWRRSETRPETLLRAAAGAGDERAAAVLRRAAGLAREADFRVALPGPTGESNALALRGRGIVACLGPDLDGLGEQLAKSIALGNAVVCDRTVGGGLADHLASALDGAGAPEGLVAALGLTGGAPRALLLDDRLRAVAYDGDAGGCAALGDVLARRDGPIAPRLAAGDAPWRYGVERTLTINTTAAGGDVRLLALAD